MQEKLENDDHHHWHGMKKGSIASSGKHCPFFSCSALPRPTLAAWEDFETNTQYVFFLVF